MTRFAPIAVADVELVGPICLRPEPNPAYTNVRALIRVAGVPLGQISLSTAQTPASLADHIWREYRHEVGDVAVALGMTRPTELTANGLPAPHRRTEAIVGSDIAVVIATRNRTDILRRCLRTIDAQLVRPSQIIVVDNAPSDDSTRDMLTGPFGTARHIIYVRESRPGLGLAHNAALPHVTAKFVAFTDDDVLADSLWTKSLLAGFTSGPKVACVTGIIVPAELETREQLWTEDYMGLTKGFDPKLFHLGVTRSPSRLFPFAAGVLGSGANMAFCTSYLREVGGFDGALGTGTMSRGGDDLAAFHEVIMRGYQLAYAPSAIIRHFHNKTYNAIKRQMSGYGVGLTAYLASALAHRPTSVFTLVRRAVAGIAYILGPSSWKTQNLPSDYPRELVWTERLGMLIGPFAYARTRWERRDWQMAPHHGVVLPPERAEPCTEGNLERQWMH